MQILDKVIEASNILNELDNFEETICEKVSYYDCKVSDLYHLLEEMQLDSKKCYRFCKELKQVLNERREYKQNMSVYQKYKANIQKLVNGQENRNILLSSLGKEEKRVKTPYKNRVYTIEELEEKIGV